MYVTPSTIEKVMGSNTESRPATARSVITQSIFRCRSSYPFIRECDFVIMGGRGGNMAEGAASIDQREAKAHRGPPLIRSDPSILFHFPHPSLCSFCLPKAFSSPLVSPGCSFEAMNSVSIKGLLKALLPRRFLPLKAENTLGDHWEGERAMEGAEGLLSRPLYSPSMKL